MLPASDGLVESTGRALAWKPGAAVVLDIDEFGQACAAADEALRRADDRELRPALEEAVRLYAGDLLPACTHEWIVPDRERLRRAYAVALERLVRVLEDARDYAGALTHALRLQQLEPTHEATYCTRMRLHLLSGDRAAALQVYQECVAVLRRELAVGPGPAVRELHERLLGGTPAAAAAPEPATAGGPELPLRGRNPEWLRLRDTWEKAARGRAHVVVVEGDAGIGKSRLAEELCVWVERQGGTVARSRSYAAEGRLAFAPAVEWLRTPALHVHLPRLDAVWRTEVAHLLPELAPAAAAPAPSGDGGQRHRLFEAMSRAVLARQGPVLLLLDDLQWTDVETLEWLRFLLRFAPGSPLLVAGTIRTGELASDHPLQRFLLDLRRDGQVTEIQLGPLSATDAALVAADVAQRPLSTDEAAWLYDETEGNPLFVVERVRAGISAGPAAAAPAGDGALPLPPKVHAVIAMRLAQLSPEAREVAAVAAVIGRGFRFELLAGVCGRAEAELGLAVDELWRRRILIEREPGSYDFSHDKLREVAYAETSAPRRRLLHRRAAAVLAQLHADNPEPVWAQRAAHLEEAGAPREALDAYRRAAEAAKRVHALEEAIRLFRKALALLATLPASREHAEQALELNTALGACLVASYGYPDPGGMDSYERAVALCRELGRPTEAPVLRALAIAALTVGRMHRAEVLGHELLAVHARTGDPVASVEGHYVLGVSQFWLGRFAESRANLEESLRRFDPRHRNIHLDLYAQDPEAVCLCRLAMTLAYLGRADQARARLDEALAVARALRHPHTEAYVSCFGAFVCADLGDAARAGELLDALERLTAKHTIEFWDSRGRVLRCLLRAEATGDRSEIERAEELMARLAARDVRVNFTQFYGLKARAQLARGAVREGLAAVDQGLAQLTQIDERYYEPELHRLRGELLRAQGAEPRESEARFLQALARAREQGAKAGELRAALSLARLWSGQRKKRAAARELLATVTAGFTEGFGSADLSEARVILEEGK